MGLDVDQIEERENQIGRSEKTHGVTVVVVLVVVVWLRRIHRRALSLFLCSSLSLDRVFYGVIFFLFSLFLREIIVCG